MFDDLFLFVKLVEVGGFSALARTTGMTQATVSRKIQGLEAGLGVLLIQRDTRNFEVTEIGQELYRKFYRQESVLNEVVESALASRKEMSGLLKVSLPAVLAKNVISTYLVDFLKRFPKISLHISYSSSSVDIVKSGFNLAVAGLIPRGQDNIVRLLYKFKLQLYASPAYLNKHGAINSLDDLGGHLELVGMLSADDVAISNYVATNLNTGDEVIINRSPRMYLNNSIHAIDMALHGEIVVGGWDALVQSELDAGKLVKILPEYYFGDIPCYLVRRSGTASLLEQQFINFIEDCFAKLDS